MITVEGETKVKTVITKSRITKACLLHEEESGTTTKLITICI
jgi:hypothetical protein